MVNNFLTSLRQRGKLPISAQLWPYILWVWLCVCVCMLICVYALCNDLFHHQLWKRKTSQALIKLQNCQLNQKVCISSNHKGVKDTLYYYNDTIVCFAFVALKRFFHTNSTPINDNNMASAVADVRFLHLKQVFITSSPTALYDSHHTYTNKQTKKITQTHTHTHYLLCHSTFEASTKHILFHFVFHFIFIFHTPLFLD